MGDGEGGTHGFSARLEAVELVLDVAAIGARGEIAAPTGTMRRWMLPLPAPPVLCLPALS